MDLKKDLQVRDLDFEIKIAKLKAKAVKIEIEQWEIDRRLQLLINLK